MRGIFDKCLYLPFARFCGPEHDRYITGGSEDVMLGCTSGSPLPFLTLEPPISDTDYNFALDITEGVYDLFDFNF